MDTPLIKKKVDQDVYQHKIRDLLPENIIDIHTHIWSNNLPKNKTPCLSGLAHWPSLVAKENQVEDLIGLEKDDKKSR